MISKVIELLVAEPDEFQPLLSFTTFSRFCEGATDKSASGPCPAKFYNLSERINLFSTGYLRY